MPDAHDQWKVFPHGPIEKLASNLWRVQARLPGTPIDRTMLIAKRKGGDLVIHNAIALGDAEMTEIEAWGPPSVLIVPNGAHRLDAAVFKKRYPAMRVIGPGAGKEKIEKVVKVDATILDGEDESVRYEPLEGAKEGVMIVRSDEGTTLAFCDVLMNLKSIPGFGGLLMGMFGFTSPSPKVTFPARMFAMTDKNALRAEIERRAGTPNLWRLEVGHGAPLTTGAAEALRKAASML